MTDTHQAPQALRAEALESLLVEKGLLDPAAIDSVIETFNERIGPKRGAALVAKAWKEPAFKARLLTDATAVVKEMALEGGQVDKLVVVENTPEVHNVVVCTLCSCYPWALLGLPPKWYKDPAYRSRIVKEPRTLLAEMGLALAPETRIQVWDSSAEIRYLVLPMPPEGSEGMSEAALAEQVSRDAMIGVARL